jgi:hypothetical protein
MKINLYDGTTFEDNGVGIVAAGDVEINAYNAHFRRNGSAIEAYQPEVSQQLGLPANTPFDLVQELAQAIVKAQAASVEEKIAIASKSRLNVWLTNTANVVKTAKDLVDIAIKVAVFSG